jgi:hypothetical protein
LMKIFDDGFVPGAHCERKKALKFKKPNSPNAFINCSKMSDEEAGALLQNVVDGSWDMAEFSQQCLSYKAKRHVRHQLCDVILQMAEDGELKFDVNELKNETTGRLVWEKIAANLKNATAPAFMENWTAAAAKAEGGKLGEQFEEQVRQRLLQDDGAKHFVSCCFNFLWNSLPCFI